MYLPIIVTSRYLFCKLVETRVPIHVASTCYTMYEDMHVFYYLIVLRTLDDEELFTQEKYFSLSELREISLFLNQLTYSMIMGNLSAGVSHSGLFNQCHSLLTLLYSRDARRSFVDPDLWLIRYMYV
jgi:hypothetical protein